jgi:uncharacterized membrane protein YagU involved in acid resistance
VKRASLIRFALIVVAFAAPVAAMAAGRDSGMGWFGEHVLNAIIHAVIYGVLFKVFHAIGLVPSIILGGVILVGAYLWYRKRGTARA